MADIRCSNCGENNPDFFDVCQFCQSPLKPESMVHIGEEPTKKDTGELEEILPSWLKEARQQSREEVGDESLRSETKPKVQKNEAPDLLAGLASQADDDEDDVPDWLASINPVADKVSSKPSTSKEDEPSDFFAQFRQNAAQPPQPPVSEPTPEKDIEQPPVNKEESTDWFSQQESSEPEMSIGFDSNEPAADDNRWMNGPGSFDSVAEESSAEKEPEDLGWLHDLESASKKTGELSTPQQDGGFDFSSASDSGEDLSWLNDLESASAPSHPAQSESSQDDMSWLNELGGMPAQSESAKEDLSWLDNLGGTSDPSQPSQPSSSQEDLSWLKNLGGTPETPQPEQPASSEEDQSWSDNFGSAAEPATAEPVTQQNDLSWFNNLDGTADPSQTAEIASAESEQSDSPQGDDLDWLNNLGGTTEPATAEPVTQQNDLSWFNNLDGTADPSQTAEIASAELGQSDSSQGDDLDWLNNLGGTSEPATEEPATQQNDLSWFNNLDGTADPSQTAEIASAESGQSDSPHGDDLDWLNNLGGTTEPSADQSIQPESSGEDLSWLGAFGSAERDKDEAPEEQKPVGPSTLKPFSTAPLNELLKDQPIKDSTPDWLKNAMEEPSMPAPGDLSMEWFSEHDKSSKKSDSARQIDELNASIEPQPVMPQQDLDLPVDDSSSSSQDIDSLFNVDMPDWLSQEPQGSETVEQSIDASASGDDTLSPVELPSWVQAMRPVDSSIDESVSAGVDKVTEQQGPLAGFRGVIPIAPIGSSLRPKAFSTKLQVSEEQQAGATLIEQILANESFAQPAQAASMISSQNLLRLVLSVIFVVVLGLVLGFGSQIMPIAPSNQLTNIVANVPDASPVLVVVDYEPPFAGELEATSGPLLDQLALSKQSIFVFVSMSPNGSALVDRLITNTKVTSSDGTKYQPGTQYYNLGYLPGGSTGVLGFIEDPVNEIAKYPAVVLMTDNNDTSRMWIEQLKLAKESTPELASQSLFVVSSAQSGPMLAPYVSSGQADILVNGLKDAASYEYVNTSRPGIARSYWDAFGVGLLLAILAIAIGSAWNILTGFRERRAQAEQG